MGDKFDDKVAELAKLSFEEMKLEFPTSWSLEGWWAWAVYEAMMKKLKDGGNNVHNS